MRAFWLLFPAVAWATPSTLGFDGRLVNPAGDAIDGAQLIRVALHTDPVADTEVWWEEHGVTAMNGYFHVDLGATTALEPILAANPSLYVEVSVGGQAMTPRSPLNAAPYSVVDADTLGDLTTCDVGDSVRWTGSAWACDPQPAITAFECKPPQWDVQANAQICSVNITPTVDSLVVTTANGHWYTGSESYWCIVEIVYPGEGTYYTNPSPPSPYANQDGSAHGYPGTSWDAFSITRAKLLPGGQSHTIYLYASEHPNSPCQVNGASLHGWIIPQP